jgi:hypothetical protein
MYQTVCRFGISVNVPAGMSGFRSFWYFATSYDTVCLPGCHDDREVTSPDAIAGPPPVVIADLPISFEFRSENPSALAASETADDLLMSMWSEAGHAQATFYPTTLDNWWLTDDRCWACAQDWRPDIPRRILCTVCPQDGHGAWTVYDPGGGPILAKTW